MIFKNNDDITGSSAWRCDPVYGLVILIWPVGKGTMKTIKFNHIYAKLLDEHNDVIEYATLIDVRRIDPALLHEKFINYDTEGIYQLDHGFYLMLIFLKPPESEGTCAANLFITLRRSNNENDKYYYSAIGETFLIDVEK